ncbi:hypothetical protein MKEN_01197400 [Mycena kentingensis (nom. inval.)]|nr:hypothetical protein MKEN_01197400 [Mycena kentingensis (nom. inval.)]
MFLLVRSSTRIRRLSALPKLKSQRDETLNVLEATATFLPRVLGRNETQLRLWDSVLASTLSDVRLQHSRPIRLIVWGANHSVARDIVTALLEEPFASDTPQTRSMRQRWDNVRPGQTTLTNDVPLTFLNRFDVPVQLTETRDAMDLAHADVAIVVSPRIADLQSLNVPRSDIVVLDMDDLENVQAQQSSSRSMLPPSRYLLVSPSQALKAIAAVKDAPSSPEAVQRYQSVFAASRMPYLIHSLEMTLQSITSSSLPRRAALSQARGALAVCRAALQESKNELDRVADAVSALRAQMEEERVKAHTAVLGQADAHVVDRAVDEATQYVKVKVDRMRKWRRAMWSVDEITTSMTGMVRRVWRNPGAGLEHELIFHCGRLEQLQRTFTARALALCSPSNAGTLHSSVLDNTLRQLVAVPTYRVRPGSLLDPLTKRTQTIIEAPTARLHVAGQRALVGMFSAVGTGMVITWSGYLGFFLNANGLMSHLALEPGTAVATGMLVSVAGIHWAARRWSKGVQIWWDDFLRVAGGVKQDVTDALGQTMEKQVLIIAETACTELKSRIDARQAELSQHQVQLDALLAAVEELERKRID